MPGLCLDYCRKNYYFYLIRTSGVQYDTTGMHTYNHSPFVLHTCYNGYL
jgi:hypothetical protein